MDENDFKELFHKIVEKYQISPDRAAQMLQRILTALRNGQKEGNIP